jgi:hypothetical protein
MPKYSLKGATSAGFTLLSSLNTETTKRYPIDDWDEGAGRILSAYQLAHARKSKALVATKL